MAGLRESFTARPLIVVLAMMRDKAVTEVLELLAGQADTIVATGMPAFERAMPAAELAELAGEVCGIERVRIAATSSKAMGLAAGLAAQSGPDSVVLVVGSVYLAGEVRDLLTGQTGVGGQWN